MKKLILVAVAVVVQEVTEVVGLDWNSLHMDLFGNFVHEEEMEELLELELCLEYLTEEHIDLEILEESEVGYDNGKSTHT